MAEKPMNKSELVAALVEKTESNKAAVNRMLDALAEVVSTEVKKGGAVTLPGIGKVYCRDRPARMVRNPATGEQMPKEADRAVKVTPAKALKDAINA
ncbi:MAG: HU family DNA-binding protein [Pseudomonadota bacterium]